MRFSEASMLAERDQRLERYHRLFETAKDGILILDYETTVVEDANPRICQMFRFERSHIVGKRLGEAPFLKGTEVSGQILAALNTRESVLVEGNLAVSGEGSLPSELLCNRYREDGRNVIQCNIRDISERREHERALRESEERLRLMIEGVQDYALILMDQNGNVTDWNVGAERILGYSADEIKGQNAKVFFTPEDRERGEAAGEMEGAAKNGQSDDERWHMRKDGSRFFASGLMTSLKDEEGRVRGFAKVMRDVTEKRRMEQALLFAQRREAIVSLAGGIAHDFNNLLTSILGNTDLVLGDLSPHHPARPLLIEVIGSGRRAADLTKQMLAYAGKGRFHSHPLKVSKKIRECAALMEAALPEHVRLVLNLSEDVPLIEADGGQIQQVLLNLVINAGEAFGAEPGEVTVT
ncbi:MAG: PAS domain S-box protein, partial [Acidobacteriota bacterium]|nr:PAS domain S-box protein [Acidobacteriota bacterium]